MDIVDILSARRVAGLSFSHLKFLAILSVWCPRVSKRFENLGIQVVRQIVVWTVLVALIDIKPYCEWSEFLWFSLKWRTETVNWLHFKFKFFQIKIFPYLSIYLLIYFRCRWNPWKNRSEEGFQIKIGKRFRSRFLHTRDEVWTLVVLLVILIVMSHYWPTKAPIRSLSLHFPFLCLFA